MDTQQPTPNQIIGAALREARHRNWGRKMTLREVGDMAGGLPTSTVAGYEKGTFMPSAPVLMLLLAVLNVDANQLARDVQAAHLASRREQLGPAPDLLAVGPVEKVA